MDDPGIRQAGLFFGLVFCLAFGYATLHVAIENGPDVFTLAAVVILGMIATGLIGALRNPPE